MDRHVNENPQPSGGRGALALKLGLGPRR